MSNFLFLDSNDNSNEEIIYDEAKPFDVYKVLDGIFCSAKQEVEIIDAYVDSSLFPLYFHELPCTITLKLLTMKMGEKFELVAKKYKQQHVNFEVRKSDEVHDRYLIVDNRAWIIGQSIKDAGKKPLYIVQLEDAKKVKAMFTKLWLASTKVI